MFSINLSNGDNPRFIEACSLALGFASFMVLDLLPVAPDWLGNDTSYYNNDLYVQWETKDGKVSDKVPLGTFITGHPANTTAQTATTTTTTTKATTTTTTTTKK